MRLASRSSLASAGAVISDTLVSEAVGSSVGSVVPVAGSSATATVPAVRSGAWSVSEALASGAGAVPPCFSSVKCLVSPVRSMSPKIRRPGQRPGRVRNDETVVRGWSGRGSLRAKQAWTCLQIGCLPEPGESSTRPLAATIAAVPELPDLTIVAEAFQAALLGRPVTKVEAPAPLAVRGTPAELSALVGQRLVAIEQRGKFLFLDLGRDRVVVNPMLTGRFQLAGPGDKLPTKTAVIVGFGPRSGPPPRVARWTRRAAWLPPDDAEAEVRYRDPTQMGKVYVLPAGVERAVPGLGPGELGPDADDPKLTLDVWRERIRRHPGELKNMLKNQAFVAGIGNAYSDEIVHAARLLPFRKRSSLAPEEVDALYEATRSTLTSAITVLRKRVPPTFEKQVRDFLAVHDKGGSPCPRCGSKISEVRPGGFITSYCRGCQR